MQIAGRLVPVFNSLVPNQAQDSSHDIGHDQFIGLGFHEPATNSAHVGNEGFDILPLGSGNDLKEYVGGSNGAGLGAFDLSASEETVSRSVRGEESVTRATRVTRVAPGRTHDTRFSTDASNG